LNDKLPLRKRGIIKKALGTFREGWKIDAPTPAGPNQGETTKEGVVGGAESLILDLSPHRDLSIGGEDD